MYLKEHFNAIILFTLSLISLNCASQQAEEIVGVSVLPPALFSVPAIGDDSPATAMLPITSTPIPGPPTSRLSATNTAPSTADPLANVSTAPVLASRAALVQTRQPSPERAPRSALGEDTDFGVFVVGNFNPVTYISIQNTPHTVVSSNKSSVGGGVEYRHWFSDHNALGLLYVQNPSNGKLFWQGNNYIWPQMRWDLSVLATQKFDAKRFAPFVSEGPGIVLTNGYKNCGWSGGIAIVVGLGTEYRISSRLSGRTGVTFLETKSGCYEDPTCRQTWGTVEDIRTGFIYRWGREQIRHIVR